MNLASEVQGTLLEGISNRRTFDRWPKSANGFPLNPTVLVSDLRQIEDEVDFLPVDLSWQQPRLGQ